MDDQLFDLFTIVATKLNGGIRLVEPTRTARFNVKEMAEQDDAAMRAMNITRYSAMAENAEFDDTPLDSFAVVRK